MKKLTNSFRLCSKESSSRLMMKLTGTFSKTFSFLSCEYQNVAVQHQVLEKAGLRGDLLVALEVVEGLVLRGLQPLEHEAVAARLPPEAVVLALRHLAPSGPRLHHSPHDLRVVAEANHVLR